VNLNVFRIAVNDFPFQDRSQLCERLSVNQAFECFSCLKNVLADPPYNTQGTSSITWVRFFVKLLAPSLSDPLIVIDFIVKYSY
jgi:hypothetical protein